MTVPKNALPKAKEFTNGETSSLKSIGARGPLGNQAMFLTTPNGLV